MLLFDENIYLSPKFLAATWESWTGAAFRTGTGISSEQTDEED